MWRANAREAETCYTENRVTLVRDDPISDFGLGSAWIKPSWRVETSKNGASHLVLPRDAAES
jgi:hypothetical protein